MNGRMFRGARAGALAMTVLLCGVALAAPPEQDCIKDAAGYGQEQLAEWEAVMKLATPGQHHHHLKPLEGTWDVVVRMRHDPQAPVIESGGTSTMRWILDGRFLMQEVDGDVFMGQPFKGLGFLGYDNAKQKYIGAWMDNMGTAIMTSEGTCDDTGKVFTLIGAHDDPITGNHRTFKSVTRVVDADKYVEEMYELKPDGSEFKTMDLTYTRKGLAAARSAD